MSFAGRSCKPRCYKRCLPKSLVLPSLRHYPEAALQSLPIPEVTLGLSGRLGMVGGGARLGGQWKITGGAQAGAHWMSEQDGHLSRSFCCKTMESGLAFPTAGKGGRG